MNIPQNELLLYKLFLSHPERSFYMQEIGRILAKKPGVFQRTLNKIEQEGFIQSEFIANARFFRLNKDYPVLKELSSIIRKMYGEMDIFERELEKLDKENKKIKKVSRPKRKKLFKEVAVSSVSEIEEPLPKETSRAPEPERVPPSKTDKAKPSKKTVTLRDFQPEHLPTSLSAPASREEDSKHRLAKAWEEDLLGTETKKTKKQSSAPRNQLELF